MRWPRRLGRVTAEPVWAPRSSPPFDAAAMDGIAVRAADTVGACETTPLLLDPDAYDVVDTGDPHAGRAATRSSCASTCTTTDRSGARRAARGAVPPYQHVRSIGEDVSATELLLPEGHRLRPVDVAAAAAAGVDRAARPPARRGVVVLPTGDEIRAGRHRPPRPGEILDTNSLMLAAQAREAGCEASARAILPDDPGGSAPRSRDGGRGRAIS